MKVTESTTKPDGKGNILFYDIRTDKGTCLGSSFKNINPLGGDPEVTLEDAKKNATLWASAPDLLEALELATNILSNKFGYTAVDYFNDTIKKARGL